MAIPVEQFQPETFAQANPMLTGMMGVADLQNQIYNNQILQAKAGVAQGMAQAGLTQEQAKAGVAPQMAQAGLQQAQAIPGQTKAQTALLASEAAKNQLYAKYPQLLMSGPAGTIGQLDILGQMQPNANVSTQMPAGTQTLPSGLNAQSAGAMGIPTTAQGLTVSPSQFGVGAQTPMQQYQQLLSMQKNAQLNTETWNNMQNAAYDAANQAAQQGNALNKFSTYYDASQLKGLNGGWIPSTGFKSLGAAALKGVEFKGTDLSPEQLTDTFASQLVAPTARQMFSNGRLTNMDVQLASQTKPNRALDQETKDAMVQSYNAQLTRTNELSQFVNSARQLGIQDPHVVQNLWNSYQNQMPAVANDGSINTKYLNHFRDFLTHQTITQAQRGQPITPIPVKEDLQAQGVMPAQAGGNIPTITATNRADARAQFMKLSDAQKRAYLASLPSGGG